LIVIPGLTRNPVFEFLDSRFRGNDSTSAVIYVNKLTDSQQEAAETQTWLEFALRCHYIDEQIFESLDKDYEEIFAMLFNMERKADTFCKNIDRR